MIEAGLGVLTKPSFRLLAKIAALLVGVYLLVAFDLINEKTLDVVWTYRSSLAAMAAVYAVSIGLVAVRWYFVLRAVNFRLPMYDALMITLISFFFSSFLPGAVSADGVKLIYLFRYRQVAKGDENLRRSGAVAAVAADRILGVFGLLVFTCCAVGLGIWSGIETDLLHDVGLKLIVLLLLGVAGTVVAFLFATTLRRIGTTRGWFGSAWTGWILSLIDAMLLLRTRLGAILIGVSISVFNQFIAAGILWLIVGMMISEPVAVLSFLLAAAISMVANVLPLTPGGIGVAEVTFDWVLHVLQPNLIDAPFGSAFLVFRIVVLLTCACLGGLALVFYRTARGKHD